MVKELPVESLRKTEEWLKKQLEGHNSNTPDAVAVIWIQFWREKNLKPKIPFIQNMQCENTIDNWTSVDSAQTEPQIAQFFHENELKVSNQQ